jgi:NitT/TauT family transport system permease protein
MSTVAAPRRLAKSRRPHRNPLAALVPGTSALALLGGAILWELGGRLLAFRFFPPLSDVLVRLWEMLQEGVIIESLGASLSNLAIGFVISVVVGVAVGLLMGVYPRVDAALDVYVNALLTAPSLVFAPIFFSIFGLGRESIIAVIVMYALFLIIINTAAAVRSVPRPLIEMGRSYSASDWQLFWKIILPAATPLTMAAIRVGGGAAVKGMVNGEMFIAVVGLGAVVTDAGRRFDATSILAVLIVMIVIAFALIKAIQIIDQRLTSWLPETSRSA